MEVFIKDNEIATKNLNPGIKVYDEKLIQDGEAEYRVWNPSQKFSILEHLQELLFHTSQTSSQMD